MVGEWFKEGNSTKHGQTTVTKQDTLIFLEGFDTPRTESLHKYLTDNYLNILAY